MTGNVVFLGFALAGAPGLSAPASIAALAAFLLGAVGGGRIGRRHEDHRGHRLRTAAAVGVVPLAVAALIAAAAGQPVSATDRYLLIVPLGLAMGIQNATARGLAVPDLTTTVLTQTLTGIAADSRLAGGDGGHTSRRLIAVVAMLAGALLGALLVVDVGLAVPLAIATGLLAASAVAAQRLSVRSGDWIR
jgi:uncharacterized membrane protein YoaK (UPF0700 family)